MKIYEVMQSSVCTVTENEELLRVIHLMNEHNIGFIVVVEDKMPIGVLTDRDIALAFGKGATITTPVKNVMKRYVLSINQNDDVANASDMMGYMQIKRLVVTNDFDQLSGVLSLSDLARNVLTEEYAFEALTEISYDYSTPSDNNKQNIPISAFMV